MDRFSERGQRGAQRGVQQVAARVVVVAKVLDLAGHLTVEQVGRDLLSFVATAVALGTRESSLGAQRWEPLKVLTMCFAPLAKAPNVRRPHHQLVRLLADVVVLEAQHVEAQVCVLDHEALRHSVDSRHVRPERLLGCALIDVAR